MRRLAVLLGSLLVLTAAATPAAAARDVSVPVHGVVYTTMDPQYPPPTLHIVTPPQPASHLSTLGRVTLLQLQTPTFTGPLQGLLPGGIPVPTTGLITLQSATLTGADGSTLSFGWPGAIAFGMDVQITEAGFHPIAFSGSITVLSGTGRFADLSGSVPFSGEYSFALNRGFMAFDGTLTAS